MFNEDQILRPEPPLLGLSQQVVLNGRVEMFLSGKDPKIRTAGAGHHGVVVSIPVQGDHVVGPGERPEEGHFQAGHIRPADEPSRRAGLAPLAVPGIVTAVNPDISR